MPMLKFPGPTKKPEDPRVRLDSVSIRKAARHGRFCVACVTVIDFKTKKNWLKTKALARFKNVRLRGRSLPKIARQNPLSLIRAYPGIEGTQARVQAWHSSEYNVARSRLSAPVIAVTGMRGKSITSALIALSCASGKSGWAESSVSPLTFRQKSDRSRSCSRTHWQCESLSKSKRRGRRGNQPRAII